MMRMKKTNVRLEADSPQRMRMRPPPVYFSHSQIFFFREREEFVVSLFTPPSLCFPYHVVGCCLSWYSSDQRWKVRIATFLWLETELDVERSLKEEEDVE